MIYILPSARQMALVAALAPVSPHEIAQALHEMTLPVASADDQLDEIAHRALTEARRRVALDDNRS